MCGIVGAVAERNVVPILLDALKRLEYRGYDSAGALVLADNQQLHMVRREGKVAKLAEAIADCHLKGSTGIAHTRWATHGKPCERNAHPHVVGDRIAIVHNGIIENHEQIRDLLTELNYKINSDTDSEIIAARIYELVNNENHDLLSAVLKVRTELQGAFAFVVLDAIVPGSMVAIRHGNPLVIGLGLEEVFLASDPLALQKVAQDFIYLEEGDVVEISTDQLQIFDHLSNLVTRTIHTRTFEFDAIDKGKYRHFMQKEIFEQPIAITNALVNRINNNFICDYAFGLTDTSIFKQLRNVQIVACGTSYYAGCVARLWIEDLLQIPCRIDIASEFRYRKKIPLGNTLLVTISQSGETADTLAALRSTEADEKIGYCGKLAICNVAESSLTRESELVFLTNAGPEIGVASTKAFTTQLVGLLMLTLSIGRNKNILMEQHIKALQKLPEYIEEVLKLDSKIKDLAFEFADKDHALFLGRGINFPIAAEGALKLKEISYIHAEAYPAGELKHGPLALVDKNMPVVVLAPFESLLPKIQANIEEVYARGGKLIVFTSPNNIMPEKPGITYVYLPEVPEILIPMVYAIPMQLLAYHVAVLKVTDVDHPRNLAKSVTVE